MKFYNSKGYVGGHWTFKFGKDRSMEIPYNSEEWQVSSAIGYLGYWGA